MTGDQNRMQVGRIHALVVCGGMVALELVAPAFGFPIAWLRTGLTLALVIAVYVGFGWARWTMVALMGVGIIRGSVTFLFRQPGSGNLAYFVLIMGCYAASIYLLVFSEPLERFLNAQRSHRNDASAA